MRVVTKRITVLKTAVHNLFYSPSWANALFLAASMWSEWPMRCHSNGTWWAVVRLRMFRWLPRWSMRWRWEWQKTYWDDLEIHVHVETRIVLKHEKWPNYAKISPAQSQLRVCWNQTHCTICRVVINLSMRTTSIHKKLTEYWTIRYQGYRSTSLSLYQTIAS